MAFAKAMMIVIAFALAYITAFAGGINAQDGSLFANPVLVIKMTLFIAAGLYVIAFAIRGAFKYSNRRAAYFTDCGAIAAGVSLNCNPLQPGVKNTFYIANTADVASLTYDNTNPCLIETLVMKTGKKFYTIQGFKQSAKPFSEMVEGSGSAPNLFRHQMEFLGLSISVDFLETIRKFSLGNYIIIYENNEKGALDATRYDVLGGGSGLNGKAMKRDAFDKDSGGGWKITLASSDDSLESLPVARLFDTDVATTQTWITTLLAPAT